MVHLLRTIVVGGMLLLIPPPDDSVSISFHQWVSDLAHIARFKAISFSRNTYIDGQVQ